MVILVAIFSMLACLLPLTWTEEEIIAVQHAPMVGGQVPFTDLNDPGLLKIANFAMKYLEENSNHNIRVILGSIEKASAQVVAGIKYKFRAVVKAAHSNNQVFDETTCDFEVIKNMNGKLEFQHYECDKDGVFH